MAKLNEDLLAALYMLGFNISGSEVAEIKGEMSIKVLRPCSSEPNEAERSANRPVNKNLSPALKSLPMKWGMYFRGSR